MDLTPQASNASPDIERGLEAIARAILNRTTKSTRSIGTNLKTSTSSVLSASYFTFCTVIGTSNGGECESDFSLWIYNGNSGANRTATVKVQCDGVDISPGGLTLFLPNITGANTPNTVNFKLLNTPSAGSHTWTLQVLASAASAVVLDYAYLKITETVA